MNGHMDAAQKNQRVEASPEVSPGWPLAIMRPEKTPSFQQRSKVSASGRRITRTISMRSKVALDLPVLGQVQGGDLLGLLDLLLVTLDLALQLVNEGLHPLAVLLVFVLGIAQLLHTSLRPAQILLSVSKPSVLRVQLGLQLTDSGLHLGQRLLPSLESVLLGLIKTSLGIPH